MMNTLTLSLTLGVTLLAATAAGSAAPKLAGDDGHLTPAVFDFVKPGVTRAEVDKRLGTPNISSESVVIKDRVDLFLDEIPAGPVPGGPHQIDKVVFYDYSPAANPLEFARIVFRDGKVWYAMLPPQSSERTREKIASRYGDIFVASSVTRGDSHLAEAYSILRNTNKGLGFLETPGEGITHRIVFPSEPARK